MQTKVQISTEYISINKYFLREREKKINIWVQNGFLNLNFRRDKFQVNKIYKHRYMTLLFRYEFTGDKH